MTSRSPSFISAFKLTALLAAVLIGLFALDRFGADALQFALRRSSASTELLMAKLRSDTVVVGTSTSKYSFRSDAWNGRLLNLAQDGQTVVFSIVQAAVLPSTGGLRYLIVGVDAGDLREGMKNPNVSRVLRIAPAIAAHPEVASLLKPQMSPWQPRSHPRCGKQFSRRCPFGWTRRHRLYARDAAPDRRALRAIGARRYALIG